MKIIIRIQKFYCYLYWLFYRINIVLGTDTSLAKLSGQGMVSLFNLFILLPCIDFILISLGLKIEKNLNLIVIISLIILLMSTTPFILSGVEYKVDEFKKYSDKIVRKYDIAVWLIIIVDIIFFVQFHDFLINKM